MPKPGDRVVDPFGGIGGTAIHAACHGLQWVGCELEPRFKEMAEQNFALWARKWGNLPEWVQPRMVCGDSRRLVEVLADAGLIVSSPPYSTSDQNYASGWKYIDKSKGVHQRYSRQQEASYGTSPGQLGDMPEGDFGAIVSSPPYADRVKNENGIDYSKATDPHTSRVGSNARDALGGPYGQTPGQLGAMIVGSPPFSGTEQPCASQSQAKKDYHAFTRGDGTKRDATLTDGTPGQLGAMVVGSPPFENQEPSHAQGCERFAVEKQKTGGRGFLEAEYGSTDGNIGNSTGETFWGAARDIVQQCHMILRPHGHCVWVCKDFVRKGQRVPFSDQWQALCESLGFRLVCRHRAMLVKVGDTQKLLDGGEHTTVKSRKSFFRRLAERKGSPAIDWEDVICLERI